MKQNPRKRKPTTKEYRAWLKRQTTGSGPFDSKTSKVIAKTLRKKRVKVGGKWYVVNPTRSGTIPKEFKWPELPSNLYNDVCICGHKEREHDGLSGPCNECDCSKFRIKKNPTRSGTIPSDFRLRIIRGADGVGGPEKFWIWDSAFRKIRGGPYATGRQARDAFRILKSKGRHARKVAKRKHNPGLVKIYAKVTRIEAQKGNTGKFPGEKFFHNFKAPYPAMYGTSDRKRLIIKRG